MADIGRRAFLHATAKGLAITAAGCGNVSQSDDGGRTALIRVHLDGGPSHVDTFDPKPGVSRFRAMPTSLPGLFLSEYLPRLGRQAVHLAWIRSMSGASPHHLWADKSLKTEACSPEHTLLALEDGVGADEATIYALNPETCTAISSVEAAETLAAETLSVREAYGNTSFGAACLLTRQLVQLGAQAIELRMPGWDTHRDNDRRCIALMKILDAGLSSLIEDLRDSGLWESVVLTFGGEFGRSPDFNAFEGRNHHTAAWTVAIGGGRVVGGSVYGATDEAGRKVVTDPVTVTDFVATVAAARNMSMTEGRPLPLFGT